MGHLVDSVSYDALGRATARYDAFDPTLATTYRYDAAGQLKSLTDRRGERIDLQYDAIGRLTSKRGVNVTADSLQYLRGDTWVRVSNPFAVVESNVDFFFTTDTVITTLGAHHVSAVHAVPEDFGSTPSLTVISDLALNIPTRTVQTDPQTGQVTTYGIGSQNTHFHYSSEGLRTGTTWPGSLVRTEKSTSVHQQMEAYYSKNGVASNWTLSGDEHYDVTGRIDALYTLANPDPTTTGQLFTYDGLGELTRYEKRSGCSAVSVDSTSGHIRNCSTPGSVTAYIYDAAGNRTSQGESYAISGNRITAFGPYLLTHDADGNIIRKYNPTTGEDRSLSWSSDGRLLQVSMGSSTVHFDYDPLGRLVQRTTNGVVDRHFVYDGDQLLTELDGSFAKLADYAYEAGADHPFAVTDAAGTTAYSQLDQSNNLIGQHDGVGTTLATLTYDTWGAPVVMSGSVRGSLRWKGLHYEGGSTIGGLGLYYMRARWYDPELGRFLSEDPVGVERGLNRYAFEGNDPIDGQDPSGLGQCVFVVTGAQSGYYDGKTLVIVAAPGYWDCSDNGTTGTADVLVAGPLPGGHMSLPWLGRQRLTRDEAAFIRLGQLLDPIRTNTNQEYDKCMDQVDHTYLHNVNEAAVATGVTGAGANFYANSMVSQAQATGAGAAAESDAVVVGFRTVGGLFTKESVGGMWLALQVGPRIGCATYGRP